MWKRIKDEESDDFYYWNTETNTTQWDRPSDFIEDEEPAAEQLASGADTEKVTENEQSKKESEPVQDQPSSATTATSDYSAEYAKYWQAYYGGMANQQDPAAAQRYNPYYQQYAAHYNQPGRVIGSHNSGGQYASKGFFNAKTGRFESRLEDRVAKSYRHTGDNASRHMNHFFDFDSWSAQRGAEASAEINQSSAINAGAAVGGDLSSASTAIAGSVNEEKKPSKKELKYFKKKKQEIKLKKREWLFK